MAGKVSACMATFLALLEALLAVLDRLLGMTFTDAVRSAFRNYFNFRDTATRVEYWYFQIFFIIGGLMVIVIFVDLLWIWGLATIIPSISLTVRRFREAGLHWLLAFLLLIPFGQLAVYGLASLPPKKIL